MADAACARGICDGSGFVWVDDDTTRPCECRAERIRRTASRRLGSGVPKRFRGVSFERKPIADMDPVLLREVRDFIRNIDKNIAKGRGLWFNGDVGTGKTSLACLVSLAAEDAGRSVAVYSVPQLLARIKETYEDGSGRSYMELFRALSQVDLLQLDDLGAEKQTEWVLEQLYALVNERWQDQKSIIVTTNLGWDQLREQVGERTVSRLAEICGELIPIMGPDLRMRPALREVEPPADVPARAAP